jgi:hypothetical protein
MIYKKESELKIKQIELSGEVATESTQKIKTTKENDEIRNEKDNEGGIRHWTDNTFYVWGYQTIRNLGFKDDRVRDVFYINKVVVR